jgi:DNA-binding NarL/FixJ family response regulator
MDKIRVALIEDHDLTRFGIRMILQQSGKVEVIGEAANAVDGLSLLRRTWPDIAIVDVGLPGMDGIELTQRLKQDLQVQAKGSKPKVLMLTLRDDKAVVLAAFAAGADSYCVKDSVNSDNLLKVLQATHEGHAWIDPMIARIVLEHSRSAQLKTNSVNQLNKVTINTVPAGDKQIIEADPLTGRQLEILELIVAGYSNKEIAKQLYITVGTAKTHIRNILNKLCADDRTQAAVRALRAGLVE